MHALRLALLICTLGVLAAADPATAAQAATTGAFARTRVGDWILWEETRTTATGPAGVRRIRQEVVKKNDDELSLKTSSTGAQGEPLSRVERLSRGQLDKDPFENMAQVVDRRISFWINRKLVRSPDAIPWPTPASSATVACERFDYESLCEGREDTVQENRVWLSAEAPPLAGGVLVHRLTKTHVFGGKEVLEKRLVGSGQGAR